VGEGWQELETLDARLERLADATALLPLRLPRVRDEVHSYRISHGIETVLVNVGRGRGALDIVHLVPDLRQP